MKVKLSKYGLIFAGIFTIYFIFIFVVDPTESGPLGFLWYFSFLFYMPSYILFALIPFEINPIMSLIVSAIIFYFIGAGIQRLFNKY